MIEFSESKGFKNNINKISLEMPSSEWNVSDIELNLDNISLENETVIIEEEIADFLRIMDDKNHILSVQLNITEVTMIYAVEIYGSKREGTESPVYVQINGWNSGESIPNNTRYGERVLLNMSSTLKWYNCNFPNAIHLYPGFYSLVINGSLIAGNDIYYIYANDESHLTNLWAARYYNSSGSMKWQSIQGYIMLHKYTRWVNRSYLPSEINMTVEVGNQSYNILDGPESGTGHLDIPNLNYTLSENRLTIPISHNQSKNLIFNLTYHIKLLKGKISEGYVNIEEGSEHNNWYITPTINRVGFNYSIKVYYPSDWNDLTVYRNEINVTLEVIMTESFIHILNNTIYNEANWLITAFSPIIICTIQLPTLNFNLAQDLEVSIETPSIQGNLTFILIGPNNEEIYKKSEKVTSKLMNFSYLIRVNDPLGEWKAITFWYNDTAAGVDVIIFTVSAVPITAENGEDNSRTPINVAELDLFIIYIVLAISTGLVILSVGSLKVLKKYKLKNEALKQKKFNQYKDLLNLNSLIVISKKSGVNVYEKIFSGKKIDPTLISGFLEAIRGFGIELTDAEDISQTIKLEYKNSKIIMSDFKDFRLIIIMRTTPSHDFVKESIKTLSYEIEEKFGKSLETFKGERTHFEGITNILKNHLNISLILPLEVVLSKDLPLTHEEKALVNRALIMTKKSNSKFFYARHLIPENINDTKPIDAILKLVDKGVFQPKI
ncbi:MAG: hypothetical protein EU532_11750 [Promethearchaeota archaeon]|nr:MAG: hypothetical protein EU532_11750 [Candidatus Lokiarchaeota archaeon]